MNNPTHEQALAILRARASAAQDLTAYARYVDIPGVPLDAETAADDRWDVVETPLAAHHVLITRTLDALVKGQLRYDAQALDSAGVLPPPHGVRPDGGGSVNGRMPPLETPEIPSSSYSTPHSSPDPENQNLSKINARVPPAPGVDKTDGYMPLVSSEQDSTALVPADRGLEVCRRVMLMFPPGSAKSTYASVVFPTWDMGRVPGQEIILTGWGDPVCKRHGKRARQLAASPAHKSVFGCTLDPSSRAAEQWEMTNGSSYKSSGILSGVAGFRCDGLVWDDLTKSRKEADSLTIRNDTYNAYLDDIRSRKKPNAWEVGIGTRWHEDEIMGRILPEGYAGESGFMLCRDGNVWLVLCIAAQCERKDDPLGRKVGEMLWTEWFAEDYWNDKRINPRSWASLYQQRPAPEEGVYFLKHWRKDYDTLPDGNTYISFDPAVSEEEDADETAIMVWRVDEFARVYLIDEWVQQVTMDKWIAQLISWIQIYRPMKCISESGVIRRASEPFIRRAMMNTKTFATFEYVTRHADKSAMARPAQAMCSAGQIYTPKTSVGNNFWDELLRFPAARKDHRVDAFANLCLHLEDLWAATAPSSAEEKKAIIGSFGGEPLKIKSFMPPRFPKKKSRWART